VGEFIGEYGLFLAAVTVVALLVIVISAISVAGSRVRSSRTVTSVRKLNERLDGMRDALRKPLSMHANSNAR
jgi:hypothetical protein